MGWWTFINADKLLAFEKSYEPLGFSALILLVITGVWMSLQYGITMDKWFSFSNNMERVISYKLLLLLTVMFALSAQLKAIPRLKKNPAKVNLLAFHIICVTIIGVTMLILGSFVRYGGID